MAYTHQNLEVILFDFGSSGRTVDIVRCFNSKNLSANSEANRDVPYGLSRGSARATGEILCWLNVGGVCLSRRTVSLACESFSSSERSVAIGQCKTTNEVGFIAKRLYDWASLGVTDRLALATFISSLFIKRLAWDNFGGSSENCRCAFEYEPINAYLMHVGRRSRKSFLQRYVCSEVA